METNYKKIKSLNKRFDKNSALSLRCGGAGFHHNAGLELHRHVKNTSGSEVYLDPVTVFKTCLMFFDTIANKKTGLYPVTLYIKRFPIRSRNRA